MANVSTIRGVALITAMLVTALVSIVALDLVARQQFDIRRTGNLLNYDQALLYSQGMEAWAARILARDAEEGVVDHLGEVWAMHLPPLPVEGGELLGELVDQQGLYNVNNLVNGAVIDIEEMERFQRLLAFFELPLELADAVADWIDPDQEPRLPGGAEDQEYLLLHPPYRAANRPLQSVTELRPVKGFSAEVYRRIAPFLTALPERTPININTAPLPVLVTLAPDLQPDAVEALIEGRGLQGYPDPQSFSNQPLLANRNANLNAGTGINVGSRWFLVRGRATIGRLSVEFYSLLARDKGRVITVRHSQGAW